MTTILITTIITTRCDWRQHTSANATHFIETLTKSDLKLESGFPGWSRSTPPKMQWNHSLVAISRFAPSFVKCDADYKKVKKERIVLREIHLRTTGRHLSNGITQCYLLPDRGGRPAFTPTGQVGTRFIDPVRMKGWVGLVGWLHTEMVYPSTDGHPSEY